MHPTHRFGSLYQTTRTTNITIKFNASTADEMVLLRRYVSIGASLAFAAVNWIRL